MNDNFQIKFTPPVMPFAYNEEQARIIFQYMELYYRMVDVYEIIAEKQKLYFMEASTDEKNQILKDIAEDANEIIADYGVDYKRGIKEAIIDYENRIVI